MNQFNGTIQSENANITDHHLLRFNKTPFIQATEHELPRMGHDHLIPVQSVLKEVKVSTPVQAKTVEQPSQIARDKSNKLCDESVCEQTFSTPVQVMQFEVDDEDEEMWLSNIIKNVNKERRIVKRME